MTTILHVSDLHLMADPVETPAILDAFVTALGSDRDRRPSVDLLCITGDVFDSATLDPALAVPAFSSLLGRMREALGADVPTVIVPGNHDRRRAGLFGPHREALFGVLRERADARTWVHGCAGPFLADVVPPSFHGQPLWIIAYDSTFLPRGLVSAGGMIRQEDLLDASARIGTAHPEWPVLFLLHHHLVPTPLTDLGAIEAEGQNRLVRFGIERVLPSIVSNADREELTMTALGAGTALSTLHTLNRPVLALHGHKHYATARMLDATHAGQGDVLIVSAGSAGTAQTWSHGPVARDVARLWPSFNSIVLEDDLLDVTTVSFGWKGSSAGEVVHRPHVRARRCGAQWLQEPIDAIDDEPPRLAVNECSYELTPSRAHAGRRWDFVCTRTIVGEPNHAPSRYIETIEHEPEARLVWLRGARTHVDSLPATLEIPQDPDRPVVFSVEGGVSRTFDERPLDASPYAWLGLMSRYATKRARLEVRGLGSSAMRAFASVADLGSGLERPIALERSADGSSALLDYPGCPARQLLRIWWPLARR